MLLFFEKLVLVSTLEAFISVPILLTHLSKNLYIISRLMRAPPHFYHHVQFTHHLVFETAFNFPINAPRKRESSTHLSSPLAPPNPPPTKKNLLRTAAAHS